MNVKYLSDTGQRYEWQCEHGDCTYVVSYNYDAGRSWTVQRLRKDGLREVLSGQESDEVLSLFPKHLQLAPGSLGTGEGRSDLADGSGEA